MSEYARADIAKAGRIISSRPPEATEQVAQAFLTAHEWRYSHVLPMRRARDDLRNKAMRLDRGTLTAARLKRLSSIQKKLRRTNYKLWQLQDLGGCRAIAPTIEAYDRLVATYRSQTHFEVAWEKDYVAEPKNGGYRSHHLVICVGPHRRTDQQRLIEIQLRSGMQHAWATAVEAVGLVRREDLKGGNGSADWLRFFAIMASEIAVAESRPEVPGVPTSRAERLEELIELERRLDALRSLDQYNQLIHQTERQFAWPGSVFVVQFDYATNTVSVSVQPKFAHTAQEYFAAERSGESQDTVIVEVNRVTDLRAAYPNYFLDVRAFTQQLRVALDRPEGARTPVAVATDPSPAPVLEPTGRKYDPAWIRRFLGGPT